MKEEERLLAGKLFTPADPDLVAIKLRSHDLSQDYNATREEDKETRDALLREIFAEVGEGVRVQGPIYIHYGKHTKIGAATFINFNFTCQDDALVTIGAHCDFGPGVTIVTPNHPLLPDERRSMVCHDGVSRHLCHAEPVVIGDDCWLGANVTVCPGVTIGNGCTIGAGSVVTKDIPDNCIAVGVPAKVIRRVSEDDRITNTFPELR